VPALSPEKIAEYSTLFEKSGPENGLLSGLVAKQIFERARLPNEVLGRIWGLSDTQGRGTLDVTEFVIAMHLLASYKSGQMRGVPSTLPPGLFEAAARRAPARVSSGSRPGSGAVPAFYSARPQSPITRAPQVSTPLSLSAQSTGEPWAVSPADKARFDSIFATVDRQGRGFITGDQAVEFFGNARLPEEILAQIWDLADINSEGQLNRDEFAVAMYLIRQQRGTKDGRGILPSSLPPALVPPSMRRMQIAPPQPTAPAFENAAPTKPRSAADDLFGLDAFGPPPVAAAAASPQIPQSTGGTDAGPFANPPGVLTPQTTSTTFKPFVPTSTFGRGIIPQSTGSPAPQVQAPAEDLLGDADPVVNARITNEASELGNLSNQVSSLSKQMTELHGERKTTEQELNSTSAQKKAFEGRLAQLRSLYEKEVQEVKALREQLTASKNEVKRLHADAAMIDGTHQDLSAQHQQLRAALESDQRENASLKERIRQMNQEIEQLKPQVEKLKSDARQQKGLVAINKKQLATNEAERDRIKAEIAAAQKEVEDALREAEESARQLEASRKELEEARNVPVPVVQSPPVTSPPVVSPAPSSHSNPFFRRNTDTTFSPPIAEAEPKDSHSAFDSIFGPSFAAAAAPAPTTSFSGQASPPTAQQNPPRIESPDFSSTPRDLEPPAPPQSRQISSAALPFRRPLEREDSVSSSVKVAAPASRVSPNDTPQALTPTASTASPTDHKDPAEDPFTAAAPDEEQESVRRTLPQPSAGEASVEDTFGKPSTDTTGDIPGAFPGSRTQTPGSDPNFAAAGIGAAPIAAEVGVPAATTNGDKSNDPEPSGTSKGPEQNFDDLFGGPAHQRSASQKAADFDSAFASIGQPKAGGGEEFPDIQELGGDDDESSEYSEDETPMKFEDDFNTKSPPRDSQTDVKAGKQPEIPPSANALAPRPPLGQAGSTASSLPGPESQQSPPTYGDSVPDDNPTHFPREYKGLLPEREDPTSPTPTAGGSTHPASPPSGNPPSYGPEAHPRSPSDSNATAPPPTKAAPFDFDSAFSGVGAAPVEDDDDDDEDEGSVFNAPKNSTADFDPTFDSPPRPSHQQFPSPGPVTNGAPKTAPDDFYSAVTAPSVPQQAQQPTSPAPHDWDALFAPLDNNAPSQPSSDFPQIQTQAAEAPWSSPSQAKSDNPTPAPAPSSPVPAATSPPAASLQPRPQRPQPGRALSAGTEHDDPILKRLTAMGWAREESLAALEKFDYNIDKVSKVVYLYLSIASGSEEVVVPWMFSSLC
jgi:epidermal growth factor receptor substrate 15